MKGYAKFIGFEGVDVIAGVATAGISWGILVADILNKPFIYVRSAPKDHGLENLAVWRKSPRTWGK